MSKNLASLCSDAIVAGYSVERTSESVKIYKMVKINKSASKAFGLMVYSDGSAVRIDVDLSAASVMRSYKAMRNLLSIS